MGIDRKNAESRVLSAPRRAVEAPERVPCPPKTTREHFASPAASMGICGGIPATGIPPRWRTGREGENRHPFGFTLPTPATRKNFKKVAQIRNAISDNRCRGHANHFKRQWWLAHSTQGFHKAPVERNSPNIYIAP